MTRTSAGELQPRPIPLNIDKTCFFLLFLAPFSRGHPKASGFCFQSERVLYGREPNAFEGGTGKAEAAKLQDAGISPKQCLKKWTAENGRLPIELRENRVRGQLREPSPSKDSSEVTWPFEGATGGGNEN